MLALSAVTEPGRTGEEGIVCFGVEVGGVCMVEVWGCVGCVVDSVEGLGAAVWGGRSTALHVCSSQEVFLWRREAGAWAG